MNRKLFFLGMVSFISSIACGISIPGANLPGAAPVNSPVPSLTPSKTIAPTVTPYPTPTRRATSADFSTMIAPPEVLLPPSLTPVFYLEPLAGGGTTPQPSSVPILNLWSPTPESLQCKAELMEPSFGEDFKPRHEFIAVWRVYNTGTVPWAMGEYQFEYVSGDKLHNLSHASELLSIPVYKTDKVRFDIHLIAPKEPGRYSTTWGLRKLNKKEPFCTFSLTIDVVK